MKVREYNFSDSAFVAEVHRKSVRRIAAKDYSEEEIEVWSATDVEEFDSEDDKIRFLAVEEGKVIGHADYILESNELSGLYVHPDHTGKGVGTQLLEKIEYDAKDKGGERLWCKSTKTAKNFYKERGWDLIKRTTYEIDYQELEVCKMEKKL